MQRNPPSRLRPLRPTDRDAVCQLGADVFSTYGEYSTILRCWIQRPDVSTLVAEDSMGLLVGFVLTGSGQGPGEGGQPYVLGIGIRRSHRGSGLGSRLLNEALKAVDEAWCPGGAERVVLHVAESNHRARALFASAGFSEGKTMEGAYADGSRAVAMHRPLPGLLPPRGDLK